MRDLGVRLRLYLGRNVLAPAPYDVVEALQDVQVTNADSGRDGFQLSFGLGRAPRSSEYLLLQDGLLSPFNLVSIVVVVRGQPHVLINGIITRHQLAPSPQPGQSQLRVSGEDAGLRLDLEPRPKVYRNQADSSIITTILGDYSGLDPLVTATRDAPSEAQYSVSQTGTDLALIQQLAGENSFVFYVEPNDAVGSSTAYWGPAERRGLREQTPLTMNMGSADNLRQLTFDFDALAPIKPLAVRLDLASKRAEEVAPQQPDQTPMARQPAEARRTVKLHDVAKLDAAQAARRAQAATSRSSNAVRASGDVDVVAYGDILRARRRVSVRGAGHGYDGSYYVQQVTHQLKRGEYRQSFSLAREGLGATHTRVAL